MPEHASPALEPPTRRPEPLVHDVDPERAHVIQAVVGAIAPRLGLRLDQLSIHVDDEGERQTSQHGANGVQHRGAIYFRPGGFDPRSPRGRYLLGHELAHQAQRALTRAGVDSDAEAEAHDIGEAVAEVRSFEAPRVALTQQEPARAVDARMQLQRTVASTRRREIDRIHRLLDRILWISDTDVDNVLLTLQEMDFFTARAVIASRRLDKLRVDLIDNINDHHYKRFRAEILACYAALTPEELRTFDARLLTGLDLRLLSEEEHYAVFHVFHNLSTAARVALLKSDKAFEIKVSLGKTPSLNAQEEARLQQAEADESKRVEEEVQDKQRFAKDPQLEEDRRFVLDRMNDSFVSDAKALSVLDLLARYVHDLEKMRALAREMEDAGALDRLVRELPIKALFEEYVPKEGQKATVEVPRRKAFLMLLTLRPPYKNVQLAMELTPVGWTSILHLVTDEDAYLAYQLLKAVPQKSRRSFMEAEEGKHWKQALSEMTQQMRESASMNFYTGGKGQLDRASIETPLLDDALWCVNRLGELDGRIRMAIAAGDHRFVWEQAQRFNAYLRTGLEAIVEKYRLYNPDARGADGKAKPRKEYSPEVLQGTAFWQEGAFDTFAFLGRGVALASQPVYSQGSISAEHLSADDIQNLMGGNVAGVRFKTQEEIQELERRNGKSRGGGNFFDKFVYDMSIGKIEVESRNLEIAAIRYYHGDLLIQTGDSRLQGLKVQAGYPKSGGKNAYYMRIDVDLVELHDVLLISADSMQSIGAVTIRGARLTSGSGGVDYNSLGPAQTDTVRVPFLSPLAGLARLGWNAGWTGDVSKAFKQTRDFAVSAESIRLEGITTSSGQHIKSIELGNVAYRQSDSIQGYQRALEESWRSFPARITAEQHALQDSTSDADRAAHTDAIAQLEKRRRSVESALILVRNDQAKITALEKRRKSEGQLSAEDERELSRLQRGGATFDASSLRIHGIAGAASAADIDLFNLHGQGQLSQYQVPSKDKPGADIRPVLASLDDPSGLAIEVGSFRTQGLELKRSPPSAASLEREIKRIEERLKSKPMGTEAARKLAWLREKHAEVSEFERLTRIGVADLSETQRGRLAKLREKLFDEPSVKIADVAMEGAVVSLDFAGGLGALSDLRGALRKAALSADAVRLRNVAIAGTGVHVDAITATGLQAGLTRSEGNTTLGLDAASIVVEGLSLKQTKDALLQQVERLKKGAMSKADELRWMQVNAALAELDRLLGELETAKHALDMARGTWGEDRAAALVNDVQKRLRTWQTKLIAKGISVTQLSMSLTDLGDVLAADYDFETVLERGVTATAAFEEAEITGPEIAGAGARTVKLRGGGGSLVYGADAVQIRDFRLGSFEVAGLNYAGGGRRVWSSRTTTLQGIAASASIRFQRSATGDVAATEADIDALVIQSILADDLHYEDRSGDQAVSIEIPSGALNAVGLSNFRVSIPTDPEQQLSYSGNAGIGSIDNLKVIAALEDGVKASGTINAAQLSAKFLQDGTQVFEIGDLDVLGGEVSQRGSRVRVDVTNLKGKVTRSPDGTIAFDIPSIQAIRVPLIDWRAGPRSVSGKQVVLSTIKASGRLSKNKVVVDRINVGNVEAQHLRYSDRDSNLVVETRADDAKSGLRIDSIALTGLNWTPKEGVTAAKLDVAHIASTVAVSMGKELQLGAKLDAKGLSVELSRGGKIVAKVADLSADVEGTAAGSKVKASVHGLKASGSFDEDKIVIDSLSVPQIQLKRVAYSTPKFGIEVIEGGELSLFDTTASVVLNLNPRPKPGELPPDKPASPRLKSIVINSFYVPRVWGAGLMVSLPTLGPGAKLRVPYGRKVELADLRLAAPKNEKGPFTILPKAGEGLDLLGSVTFSSAQIDRLTGGMMTAFTGGTRLSAEGGVVSFSKKGTSVDLTSVTLKELKAFLAGTTAVITTELGVQDAKLIGVHVNETGDLKVDAIEAAGLLYEDRHTGVRVDIEQALIPNGIDYKSGQPILIERFDILAAHFKVPDIGKLGTGGGSSSGGSLVPTDLKFLDHLNGQVDANIHLITRDAGIQVIPLRMKITNGTFNYKEIESQLPPLVDLAVDLAVDPKRGVFEVSAGFPIASPVFEAPIEPADLPQALPAEPNHPRVGLPPGVPRRTRSNMVKLSIFFNGRAVGPSSGGPPPVKGGGLSDVRANLSLNGPTAIDFGWRGKIRLGAPGKPGVLDFTATGSSLKGIELKLKEVNAALDNLRLGRMGDVQVNVPVIHIKADSGTKLELVGFTPKSLAGTINSASAENITVIWSKKPQP